MQKHYFLGRGRSLPLHTLHKLHQAQTPFSHISGMGYAGVHKKDIGAMKSLSGQGVMRKKIAPLRFKI